MSKTDIGKFKEGGTRTSRYYAVVKEVTKVLTNDFTLDLEDGELDDIPLEMVEDAAFYAGAAQGEAVDYSVVELLDSETEKVVKVFRTEDVWE